MTAIFKVAQTKLCFSAFHIINADSTLEVAVIIVIIMVILVRRCSRRWLVFFYDTWSRTKTPFQNRILSLKKWSSKKLERLSKFGNRAALAYLRDLSRVQYSSREIGQNASVQFIFTSIPPANFQTIDIEPLRGDSFSVFYDRWEASRVSLWEV